MRNVIWFAALSLVLCCSLAAFAQQPPAPPVGPPPDIQPKDSNMARYEDALKQVETAIADKKYSEACRLLNKVNRHGKDSELPPETAAKHDGLKKQITAAGEALVKEAEGKLANDPVAAVTVLDDVQKWQGNDVSKKASEVLQRFQTENREAYQKAIGAVYAAQQKAAREASAAQQLKDLPRLLGEKRYLPAMTNLENIVKQHPGTKLAEEAEAKLKELQTNPEVQKAVVEEKDKKRQDELASQFNILARTYLKHGDKEEAKKYLNMIKEKCPKSYQATMVDGQIKSIDNLQPSPQPAKPVAK